MVVLSKPTALVLDEATAAKLLWQLKAIATKEVENLSVGSINSFFLQNPSTSEDSSEANSSSSSDIRGRSVSVDSVEMVLSNTITPILSFTPTRVNTVVDSHPFLLDSSDDEGIDDSMIDHHDWSNRACGPTSTESVSKNSNKKLTSHTVLRSPDEEMKQCKRKRESFVGLCTSSGTVRCTLRKKVCNRWERPSRVAPFKTCRFHLNRHLFSLYPLIRQQFSWKQYPEVRLECRWEMIRSDQRIQSSDYAECHLNCVPSAMCSPFIEQLEDYLLQNQDEYFEFSSRNYTAEQRKYNNTLTRGLLELAANEGYIFEDFTFSMVRDRIRCYYKSHSQSSRKKRRR